VINASAGIAPRADSAFDATEVAAIFIPSPILYQESYFCAH
jgi:hypothetical protein